MTQGVVWIVDPLRYSATPLLGYSLAQILSYTGSGVNLPTRWRVG